MNLNLEETLKQAALKVVADNEQEDEEGYDCIRTKARVCDVQYGLRHYQVQLLATLDDYDFIQSGEVPVFNEWGKHLAGPVPQPSELEIKAAKWDALKRKIDACYYDEEGNEVTDDNIDLVTIGEIAATACGYL